MKITYNLALKFEIFLYLYTELDLSSKKSLYPKYDLDHLAL